MNTLEIRAWFNDGKLMRASFMVIVHDGLNIVDYPIFVDEPNEVKDTLKDVSKAPMQRLLEVYNLNEDRDTQLAEVRAWRLPDDSDTGRTSDTD